VVVCACLRRPNGPSHLLPAIEVTERFVEQQLVEAWESGWDTSVDDQNLNALVLAQRAASDNSVGQSDTLRDIFGPLPFRPIAVDPRWLTSTVKNLANSIYTDRAFEKMPILGDALEDAGCDNQEPLNHCRQPGEHTRGCWVLDKVLGRE
jgi:hypothetical protein